MSNARGRSTRAHNRAQPNTNRAAAVRTVSGSSAIKGDHGRLEFFRVRQILSRQPEPNVDHPDLSEKLRQQCQFLARHIVMLEIEKARLAPAVNPKLEESLLEVRAQYHITYPRLFRVNDLPPEILANVFRYVVWSTSTPEVGIKYRLWLTWVCRHWRSVAVGDFTLWNAIWFRDPPPYDRSLAWFDRAGTAPLDLRINERDPSWNSNEDDHRFNGEQMGWLLDKLFTKLSQIRMLIIIVDTWPPALVVLDRLRAAGNAGVNITMERFELHRAGNPYVWIGPGYEPDLHSNPITLFGTSQTTSLKFLCLNGIHIDWHKSYLKNLTTIDIRRIALEVAPGLLKFRDMLKASPNLHKLSLDGAGPRLEPGDIVGLEPVELPRLVILVLGDFSLDYGQYLLSQVSAPNVRDLTLMNMNGEDYSIFLAAMTPNFPNVRLLTLYTIEVGDGPDSRRRLVKWLESMPLVSYIRIAQINFSMLEAFLADRRDYRNADDTGLTSASSQIVCPKLDILEYQSIDGDTIIRFGKGRASLGIPLRKIYVNGPWVRSVTPQEQDGLRQISALYIAPIGANTPEETEILR